MSAIQRVNVIGLIAFAVGLYYNLSFAMDILVYNTLWMGWNVFLASLGVASGVMFARAERPTIKMSMGLLWLLFMPNTIYLVTDLIHLPGQLQVIGAHSSWLLLVGQYIFLTWLGLILYAKSVQWFEQGAWGWIDGSNPGTLGYFVRCNFAFLIVGVQFLAAFGVVMGRFMRTNSWYVLTQPSRVFDDGIAVLGNMDLMLIVVILGVFGNLFYLGYRKLAFQAE